MGLGRASLFGLSCVGSGVAAYLALAWYIDATSHTVAFRPAFYISSVCFALLLTPALRLAWPFWRSWTIPVAILLAMATVFVLVLLFFLPFP